MRILILVISIAAMFAVYAVIYLGTEAFGITFPCLALALELLLARAWDR